MSLFTSILTAGTNSHPETSENVNALATDFITPGVGGTISLSNGTTVGTGSFAVNAQGSPNMTVAVSVGTAWMFATPSGQNSQALRVRNASSANVTIAANASGSTKFDYLYISLDATKAANPAVDASDVATLITSRSSSSTTDNGTPPSYGLLLAVITVANGAASITQGNITDKRSNAILSSAGISQTTSWNSLGITPNTITALGNRSYQWVFNNVDLTGTVSPGFRLRTTRTVAAPTQCFSGNGTTNYFNKTSPAGMTFTNNFVVSAWIKLTSYSVAAVHIASRYNGTSGWQFRIESTGQLALYGFNSGAANFSGVQSYASVPLNKWVHVTAQLDMSSVTNSPTVNYCMFDGVDTPAKLVQGGTAPSTLAQLGNLEVGSTNGGTALFPGKIAQLAIYSAKVTQATILASIHQTINPAATSLISGYDFNNSINDLNVSNANNLTANGSAVATNADSPFGGQAGGTISSTLDYAIVQSVTFSTNTTVVVQTTDGNTIPTTGGVSAVAYSSNAVPFGFSNSDSITRYTRTLQNTSAPTLTSTNQDLRSTGLLQSITTYGNAVAQVRVDLAISSTSDYEFHPQVWLNGVLYGDPQPAAALSNASGRANERGYTFDVVLPDGTNYISAGVFLASGAGYNMAVKAGSLTVSIVKGIGTGN